MESTTDLSAAAADDRSDPATPPTADAVPHPLVSLFDSPTSESHTSSPTTPLAPNPELEVDESQVESPASEPTTSESLNPETQPQSSTGTDNSDPLDALSFIHCTEDNMGLWASKQMLRDHGGFEDLMSADGHFDWEYTSSAVLSDLIYHIHRNKLFASLEPPTSREESTKLAFEKTKQRLIDAYEWVHEMPVFTSYVSAVKDEIEQHYTDPQTFHQHFQSHYASILTFIGRDNWLKHWVVDVITTRIQEFGLQAFIETEPGKTLRQQFMQTGFQLEDFTQEDAARLEEALEIGTYSSNGLGWQ